MKASAKSWIILIILSIVWGSSFILMKKGMEAFSSDEVAGLRIAIAFLFLVPFYIKHHAIDFKKNFMGLMLMGVFGNLIPAFLFTKAETQISSSLTGMLNALTPLFTIVVAFFWFKTKFKTVQLVGIMSGLVGAMVLLYFNDGGDTSTNVLYSLLVVAATICYAISVNGIKHYLSNMNSVTATVGAFTITGPIALAYLFIQTDFINDLKTNPIALSSLGYVSILAIVGSALSVIVYNTLIKEAGTVFASTCTYLIPIIAVIWGVLDGETVNLLQMSGVIVVIFSVYLINRR
ncbi:MAG: DMT family transporter [Sphingobacteriaceae bacterium]|jgi:drug/metabolite transporter (DMT)-like permease